MSVPTPKTLPLIAINAPSPPELPPEVNLVFRGFKTLPKTLLSESRAINVCGTFVLQYNTAPFSNKISTSKEFSSAGFSAKDAIPILESYPLILNVSFNEMGIPCKGLLNLPVRVYSSSSSLAREIADEKRISVRQLQSCCASAARLQKAVTMVSLVRVRARISEERDTTSWVEVMAISRGVRNPLVRGRERRFSGRGEGSAEGGRIHEGGMEEARWARLRCAIER